MIRAFRAWWRDRRAAEQWSPAETHREAMHPRHREALEGRR